MTKKQITMNQAFAKLEAIVDRFESGEVDIENSIVKFQEGLELAKFLKQKLNKIENEIIEVKKQYQTKKK